jgi:hypothetical protein
MDRVAYRLEVVTEVRDWLHELRRTDRAWYRQSIPLAEARYATYLKEKEVS